MCNQIRIFLVVSLLTINVISKAQSYFANGNARALGNGCYQLTSAADWQLSSVWYADKLDLTKDFDLEFDLNFGNKDDGADGIVFVLQTAGNRSIGIAGGGMGFEGFSPSLGVEFDDWNNINFGDLASDHIAIVKNGSVDHNGPNSVARPVPALTNSGNIEDGKNHLVRITWDASTNLFEVWFDCVKRQSITLDIVNSIFRGQKEVFWGFTAATGGSNNVQTACLRNNILTPDTFFLCKGESLELNARESDNNDYIWTPNQFLSDNTIQNPICTATESITYYLEYTDRCGDKLRDTIHVAIEVKPDLGSLSDIELCIDESTTITVDNEFGSITWNGEEGGASFNLLNYEGKLTVKSVNSCGEDSKELNVSLSDCVCDMWFPNIFTPNEDGINDVFGPVDPCIKAEDYTLKVYNRWGEKLFETTDLSEVWDGSINKNNVVDGVYFWVATWSIAENGELVSKVTNGTLDVVR